MSNCFPLIAIQISVFFRLQVDLVVQQVIERRVKREITIDFNDKRWQDQWFLVRMEFTYSTSHVHEANENNYFPSVLFPTPFQHLNISFN